MKIASENGVSGVDEKTAGEIFGSISRSGELTDDELTNAAGGDNACAGDMEIKYLPCPNCGTEGEYICVRISDSAYELTCTACRHTFRCEPQNG